MMTDDRAKRPIGMQSDGYNRVWHEGPPPHVGWWNSSTTLMFDRWRWWDGVAWSRPAFPSNPASIAALHAARHDDLRMQHVMSWCDYWPRDGRVERRNPETGECTGPTPGGGE